MARSPRSKVIDETTVGIYHVYTRCVRSEFLFGIDWLSGRDYSYRRDWIIDRLEFLVGSFAIDACSFAVLSNHYHLLIRNRPDIAAEWSDREVALRWWRVSAEGLEHGEPSRLDLQSLIDSEEGWVEKMRVRLASPSWFMKMLNEDIAKRANSEDEVEGHFVQGRFGARRITSDLDVLAVSLYIDLNEIRARLADCPENSKYSSVFRRLGRLLQDEQALQQEVNVEAEQYGPSDPDFWLSPIDETVTAPPLVSLTQFGLEAPRDAGIGRPRCGFLTVDLKKYLELLEHVGRSLAPGKAGRIDPDLPPLLERLEINRDLWNAAAERAQRWFDRLLAPRPNLRADAGPGNSTTTARHDRPQPALE